MEDRIEKIATTYGYNAQSRQLIEEMAELTQAINKYWRKTLLCGEKDLEEMQPDDYCTEEYEDIVEEIADVRIMLDQVEFLLECETMVQIAISPKLDRQISRITKN